MSNIKPGQKLWDGDCVYSLTDDQISEVETIYGQEIEKPVWEGLVFNGGELFPTHIEYCHELEEHTFADFRQLCINTFGDGSI